MTIEEYLAKLGRFVDDGYGQQVRRNFADNRGSSELGMLQSPTADEMEQLRRAVAIMTGDEKKNACSLGDDEIERIADDAKVDRAVLAIFVNGYILECKRVS